MPEQLPLGYYKPGVGYGVSGLDRSDLVALTIGGSGGLPLLGRQRPEAF